MCKNQDAFTVTVYIETGFDTVYVCRFETEMCVLCVAIISANKIKIKYIKGIKYMCNKVLATYLI